MYSSFVPTADSQRRHNRLTAQRRDDDEIRDAQGAAIQSMHGDRAVLEAVESRDWAVKDRLNKHYETDVPTHIHGE